MPQVSLKYNICLFYNIYKDVTLQDKVIFLFFSHTELALVMDTLPHVYCIFLIKAAVTGFCLLKMQMITVLSKEENKIIGDHEVPHLIKQYNWSFAFYKLLLNKVIMLVLVFVSKCL